MLTKFDKALIALALSSIYVINHFLNHYLGSDGPIGLLISVFIPILVWIVPNKVDKKEELKGILERK